MEQSRIEKMQQLRTQGKSFREIAAAVGVSVSKVFRSLEETPPESDSPETLPTTATPEQEPAQPRSAIIAARIDAAKQQLRAIDTTLGELQDAKTRALAAPTLDDTVLIRLEQQETEMVGQIAHLHQRIPLLEQQQEAAEAGEARARIDQIVARVEELGDSSHTALAAFQTAAAALTRAAEKIVAIANEADELTEEQEFYSERYRAFGVTSRDLSHVKLAKLPNHQDSAVQIFESLRQYWLRVEHGRTEWRRKLDALWDEQRKREREQQEAQAASAPSQSVRPGVVYR